MPFMFSSPRLSQLLTNIYFQSLLLFFFSFLATQCSSLHLELDNISNEINHRDCGGNLQTATDKLKTVTAEIESARIKKNFRKVRSNFFLTFQIYFFIFIVFVYVFDYFYILDRPYELHTYDLFDRILFNSLL